MKATEMIGHLRHMKERLTEVSSKEVAVSQTVRNYLKAEIAFLEFLMLSIEKEKK